MTLAQFLEFRHIRSSAFAVELGVPPSTVHRWLRGKRRPSSESLVKIEKATDGQVKVIDFFPVSQAAEPLPAMSIGRTTQTEPQPEAAE